MFKQERMTDYRSPWRFPPLRPYTDEPGLADAPMFEPEDFTTVQFRGGDELTIRTPPATKVQSMSSRFESLPR
jgi:hypothetical protein